MVGLAVWTWRHLDRVEVSGLSMAPTLQPGDRLVVWKTRSVSRGDVVAASDPRQPERTMLKRVVSVDPEGVFLLGDNPGQSTDSRQFGYVPIMCVLGKALYRYAPPARAGRLS
jgi:nickel-type superoxide dismutase maturation protease